MRRVFALFSGFVGMDLGLPWMAGGVFSALVTWWKHVGKLPPHFFRVSEHRCWREDTVPEIFPFLLF